MRRMIELTVMLDTKEKQPIYAQLYGEIKRKIEGGSLTEGMRLPSIRQLAQYLKISKNTVDHAYQQLLAEGYIESRPRAGYVVMPLESPPLVPKATKTVEYKPYLSQIRPSCRYDFRYGDIEPSQFPLRSWRRCVNDALDTPALLGYGDPQGQLHLREEIAKYLFQSRGVSCTPEQILVCAGTQHAVSMLVRLFGWSGRMIAMEDPGYRGVRTVFKDHDCRIQPIQVEADGLCIDQLAALTKGIQGVYVTPSHQFPLGMVLPVQKRRRLLQWAERTDAVIIEDDYDSEFRYMGQPIPSLKSLDTEDRVVYMGTFSKAFLPSVRMSYLVLPNRMLEPLRDLLDAYNQAVSPIIQHAVTLFMQRGHFIRHIRRMRRLYQAKHNAMVCMIEQEMGEHIHIIEHNSGLHLLLDVVGRKRDRLLSQAEDAGVKVYSPCAHWHEQGRCPDSYVMLGFGGLSVPEIEEGLHRLKQAWFDESLA